MNEDLAKYVLGLPLTVREELRNAVKPRDGRWFVIGFDDGDMLINEPSVFVAASGSVPLDRCAERRAYVPCSEAAILEHAWALASLSSGWPLAAELVRRVSDGWWSAMLFGRSRPVAEQAEEGATALEASIRLLATVMASRAEREAGEVGRV